MFTANKHHAWRSLFFAFIGIGLFLAAIDVSAQNVKHRTLRFAFSVAKEHPLGLGALRFAHLVATKSGGNIKVLLFPNAELGSESENLSAVRDGHIELTSIGTAELVCMDQQFTLFSLPFLFNNVREAHRFSDGPVGTRLLDRLADHGIVGLGIWELGFHSMTNSRHPIAKVEDFQGLRMRAMEPFFYPDFLGVLGVRPVQVNHRQVYDALAASLIDGQDNPISTIETARFAEVQKFMSLTRHVYAGMPLLMNKRVWDSMSAAERKIIREAADQAKDEQRNLSQINEALTIDALSDHLQVSELSATEVARWREMVEPVVRRISGAVGEFTVKQAAAELARLREK